ncbi:tetratricopeptide repeat protein [Amycolatopsis nalaikhensis]|uniref:Sel1 repeat family protein n=1 Tax=Amycolatopsis nalaikhensis TaxID=715472 RepID=A0ABY8XR76_9PSEU|nr:hypothetical protein [Amycolatopsis sp. 2-2]WIV58096.1 hypothetical protein QP939_05355 [Amycolatopsis sp. 2-2]
MTANELFQAAYQLEFFGSLEDLPEIERRYREAAAAGSPDAMARLGLIVEGQTRATMEGRPPNEGVGDLAEAAEWYRKAAELGHAQAAYFLGRLYAEKLGDWSRAEPWYRKAAAGGNNAAKQDLAEGPHGVVRRRAVDMWLSSGEPPPDTPGAPPRPRHSSGTENGGCAVLAVAAILPVLLVFPALLTKTA